MALRERDPALGLNPYAGAEYTTPVRTSNYQTMPRAGAASSSAGYMNGSYGTLPGAGGYGGANTSMDAMRTPVPAVSASAPRDGRGVGYLGSPASPTGASGNFYTSREFAKTSPSPTAPEPTSPRAVQPVVGAGVGTGAAPGPVAIPISTAGGGGAPPGATQTMGGGPTAPTPNVATSGATQPGVQGPGISFTQPEKKPGWFKRLVTSKEKQPPAAEILAPEKVVAWSSVRPPMNPAIISQQYYNDMRNLVSNPAFSDVTFYVEGKPIFAHRCILAARCAKFKEMFEQTGATEFEIPRTSFVVFNCMLGYFYLDRVEISMEIAMEMLSLSEQFDVGFLKGLCMALLQRNICVENVAWIYQGAVNRNAPTLRQACLQFIVDHFDEVARTDGFQDLDKGPILEVIRGRSYQQDLAKAAGAGKQPA